MLSIRLGDVSFPLSQRAEGCWAPGDKAVIQNADKGTVVGARWLPAGVYMQFMFLLAAPSWMFLMKPIFLEKSAQRGWSCTAENSRVCVCVCVCVAWPKLCLGAQWSLPMASTLLSE